MSVGSSPANEKERNNIAGCPATHRLQNHHHFHTPLLLLPRPPSHLPDNHHLPPPRHVFAFWPRFEHRRYLSRNCVKVREKSSGIGEERIERADEERRKKRTRLIFERDSLSCCMFSVSCFDWTKRSSLLGLLSIYMCVGRYKDTRIDSAGRKCKILSFITHIREHEPPTDRILISSLSYLRPSTVYHFLTLTRLFFLPDPLALHPPSLPASLPPSSPYEYVYGLGE